MLSNLDQFPLVVLVLGIIKSMKGSLNMVNVDVKNPDHGDCAGHPNLNELLAYV